MRALIKAAAAEPFAPPLRLAFLIAALVTLAVLIIDGGAVL